MARILFVAAVLAAAVLAAFPAVAADPPIVDVHDQWDEGLSAGEIVALMDEAGVARLFLAARVPGQDAPVLEAAARYPGRISPLIRTKGDRRFEASSDNLTRHLAEARRDSAYIGVAELLAYHAAKPQIHMLMQREYPLTDARVTAAAGLSEAMNRPFVLHIEFAAAPPQTRRSYMDQLDSFLAAHPALAVMLIHMGQLDPPDVERLIAAHANVYFIPSTVQFSNSSGTGGMHAGGSIPWTAMFRDGQLLDAWRALFVRYPERFAYGSDNVMINVWRNQYVREIRIWRRAFQSLPPRAAHLIAHENAERLWHLPATPPR